MMTPTLTKFDKTRTATNMLTIGDYEKFANALDLPTWVDGAEAYAKQRGGCFILLEDNSLMVLTVLRDDSLRRTIYKPGSWAWDDNTT